MNIEEYRALKAQEQQEIKESKEGTQEGEVLEQPETKEEVEEVKEVVIEDKPEENMIEVNGEMVNISELKNGYLRQSDYTKKTQKLANEKKEIDEALRFYNEVRGNPKALKSLQENVEVPRRIDPNQAHLVRLEEELYDMKLDNEIQLMQSKYDDFEVKDVLQFASEKQMANLEDAYILLKGSKGTSHETSTKAPANVSMEQMREELKKEIMAEIRGNNTGSIISSKSTGNVDKIKEIKITSGERKVAEGMGLSPKEYTRWRDADSK